VGHQHPRRRPPQKPCPHPRGTPPRPTP